MARAQYTVSDSPHVVDRIERDLAHVLDEVKRADPQLCSLVLTGGFARGEGATLHGVPQNDYDLIAVRGVGAPRRPYALLRRELESDLGLHVDLATIPRWRLPWVARSIFWYETALRGQVLWGPNLLGQIPIRDPRQIDATEPLRLLVNRAAGLLLVTRTQDGHALRLQAAKALLAVLDAHLFSVGAFPPTQTERFSQAASLFAQAALPPELQRLWPWFAWAYRFKVDPAQADTRRASEAWTVAARAILGAVPDALRHAGLSSLRDYERLGGLSQRIRYFWHAASILGANRLAAHPTGTVRIATLRLLEASLDGVIRPEAATACLGRLAPVGTDPLRLLESLRQATDQ